MKRKQGFTLIELIFIIVILGILASVAIPKLAATRDDAKVSVLANEIMTGVQEIASYTLSQSSTTSDLTEMSVVLKSLKDRGIATVDTINNTLSIKVGEVDDCVVLKIETNTTSEILYIETNSTSTDPLCNQLRDIIKTTTYPILLRGSHVRY